MRLQKAKRRLKRLAVAEPAFRAFLDAALIKKLFSKFSNHPAERVACALEEVIRYLQLSAASPKTIFFPGDKLMDDLWHALIVETAEYRRLCDQIRPGCFIDHSGMIFDDYLRRKTTAEIHEEQLSWLASYVSVFGPISDAAFRHLVLAQSLCERMKIDRAKLNGLAISLGALSGEALKAEQTTVAGRVKALTAPEAALIARDPRALREAFLGMMEAAPRMKGFELESIFSASTALGFTVWQHLAAMERLSAAGDWQARNPALWNSLRDGGDFVGLATTHLAKRENPSVRAKMDSKGRIALTGILPWVTGKGIFSRLLVGFELGDELVFVLREFPGIEDAPDVRIEPVDLGALEGTATVRLHLKDWIVRERDVVNRRPASVPAPPFRSAFIFPDLGIAVAALAECERLLDGRRPDGGRAALELLRGRVVELRAAAANGPIADETLFKKDECVRDSVRLLALASGGSALSRDSLALRLQKEVLLLDAVIQPPGVRKLKVEKAARG